MKVYLSALANEQLKSYLKNSGFDISEVSGSGKVAGPVDCHADIYYCALGRHTASEKVSIGKLLEGNIYQGNTDLLKPEYPLDVLYNAAAVGKYFICSKHTFPELIDASGLSPVFVRQGYVKCNLVVVDDDHVITEDEGIYKTLTQKTSLECLLVCRTDIFLPGYERGFLGGCSGRVGDEIIFNGDLSAHPDHKKIAAFIQGCGLKLKYFETYPLTDIGSIISPQMSNCQSFLPGK